MLKQSKQDDKGLHTPTCSWQLDVLAFRRLFLWNIKAVQWTKHLFSYGQHKIANLWCRTAGISKLIHSVIYTLLTLRFRFSYLIYLKIWMVLTLMNLTWMNGTDHSEHFTQQRQLTTVNPDGHQVSDCGEWFLYIASKLWNSIPENNRKSILDMRLAWDYFAKGFCKVICMELQAIRLYFTVSHTLGQKYCVI